MARWGLFRQDAIANDCQRCRALWQHLWKGVGGVYDREYSAACMIVGDIVYFDQCGSVACKSRQAFASNLCRFKFQEKKAVKPTRYPTVKMARALCTKAREEGGVGWAGCCQPKLTCCGQGLAIVLRSVLWICVPFFWHPNYEFRRCLISFGACMLVVFVRYLFFPRGCKGLNSENHYRRLSTFPLLRCTSRFL